MLHGNGIALTGMMNAYFCMVLPPSPKYLLTAGRRNTVSGPLKERRYA